MSATYTEFVDDVLVRAAHIQAKNNQSSVELNWITNGIPYDGPNAWEQSAIKDLVDRGLAKNNSNMELRLQVLGPGFREAERISEDGKSLTWRESLASVPRSDWIALAALIVSGVALIS